MPSSHAPSNPWHSPSHMTNALTTSSLAQRWSNAAAPSSCIPGGRRTTLVTSPRSGRLVWSASGIFARCGPFRARRAVNRPLLQSISRFLAMASPRLGRIPSLGRLTKTSDSSTGLMYSKYWTKSLAIPFSPYIITGPGWRWMLVRMVAQVS